MKGSLIFIAFQQGVVTLQVNNSVHTRELGALTPKDFLVKLNTKQHDVLVVTNYSAECNVWSLASGAVVLTTNTLLAEYCARFSKWFNARNANSESSIIVRHYWNELVEFRCLLFEYELHLADVLYNTVVCDSTFQMLPTSVGKVTFFDL
jgi:hypothetical protein